MKIWATMLVMLAMSIAACASTPSAEDLERAQQKAQARESARQAKRERAQQQSQLKAEIESAVRVSNSPPQAPAEDKGAVSGVDGHGCGYFGERGTYDKALYNLKNGAHGRGANFVQILSVKEPISRPGCLENTFQINGIAYAVSDQPQEAPEKGQGGVAARLAELQALKDQGLISGEEYSELRKKALDSAY